MGLAEPPHHAWRAVAAASIGNAFELFDFIMYGYFAILLLKFASFGIIFVMRPFGAILPGICGRARPCSPQGGHRLGFR
jgi:MHS family proline/betaine transporter-like MFS transporter